MTTTAPPPMPEEVRVEALELVRDLAAIAGDTNAVYDLLRERINTESAESALGALAAALILTFTECSYPLPPGEFSELSLHTTEHTGVTNV